MTLIFDAKNRQQINGLVKADIKLIRIISGLTLPVNCYLMDGTYVGSCVYNDLCAFTNFIFNLNQNDCPEFLINNGFDCTCPFDLPNGDLNINEIFQVPALATTAVTFLGSGDFDFTIKATMGTTNILCLNMKFATKPI